VSGATALVANVNDAPTGVPSITGTATQGATLTANTSGIGDVDGLGAFAYVWKADGAVIAGATSSTLVLGQAQVGKAITVEVRYTDAQGTAEGPLVSGATTAVANIDDEATGTLNVTGTAAEGGTLTASLTSVSDIDGSTTTAYRWQENVNGTWTNLSGQISATLSIPSDQSYVGKSIRVVATTTDALGGTTEFMSAGQTIANVNDVPTGVPSITGTATQGETLTADVSGIADEDGLGSFAYVWKGDGVVIAGATSSTLVLGQAQVGKAITVEVSYTDGEGTVEGPLVSGATGAVANVDDEASGSLDVTGSAAEGGTLTASLTSVSDEDGATTTAYRWQEDVGGTWTDLADETAETLSIPSDQSYVGKSIRVVATTTDALGGTTEFTSAGQTIANVNDAPTGVPTITGTATQGETLTADTSGIADLDGLGAFAYVWKADGTVIAGETSSTLVLGQAQVGTAITVEVSYTDGQDTAEGPLMSGATALVAVKVANNGSYSAANGVSDRFVIDPTQTINASISGFEAGDILEIVAWSEELGINFENPVFGDGEAVFLVGSATVTLTGLATDGFGDETTFENIFGANAITYAVI
jgi:hypothetical protein